MHVHIQLFDLCTWVGGRGNNVTTVGSNSNWKCGCAWSPASGAHRKLVSRGGNKVQQKVLHQRQRRTRPVVKRKRELIFYSKLYFENPGVQLKSPRVGLKAFLFCQELLSISNARPGPPARQIEGVINCLKQATWETFCPNKSNLQPELTSTRPRGARKVNFAPKAASGTIGQKCKVEPINGITHNANGTPSQLTALTI